MTITINNKTNTVTIARQGTQGPPGGGGGGADLSDNVPHALGTAAAGTGTKASRDDHVHAMPTATDVGADAAGAATAAVAAHVGAADPHPQYTTPSEAAAVAPVQTVAGRTGNVTLAVADVSGAVDTADARLSDAREWTASTVTQAEAEAGTDTNRKAWSVLRVWQAIAAWWAASSAKTKLDGIAAGATVGADWNANVSNKPTLGTAAAHDVGDFATAAQGAKADSALQPNAPITGATKTKITYDADGLVTAGADATTADIADSTNKRYVTDAQLTVIGNTSGTNTGDQTDITGNAGTATALQTARTIDGQTFDGTANITVIAPGTHAATSKATPVDADELPLVDSAASNVLKKLTWANLKATVKTYFDTLYQAVLVSGTNIKTINGSSVLGSGDLTVSGSGDFVGPASATDNAAVRFDTTTGKLGQDSALIIGDVSGSSLPVSTTPGNAIAISATAPTQTTGAQAGVTASLAASAAVAGSSTVGAAAGGVVTVEGGAAARLTSGNADGGSVRLKPGAGVGTGFAGQVLLDDDGTETRPALAFDIGGNKAYGLWYAAGVIGVSVNGVRKVGFSNGGIALYNGGSITGDASNPGFFYGLKRNRYDLSSSTTLTSGSYNGSTLTNSTAAAAITSTLASAAQGWNHTFIDDNATYRWTIKPNTADTIIWPDGTVVSATGSIVSTARYDAFDVEALDATVWLARNVRGTFTVTA